MSGTLGELLRATRIRSGRSLRYVAGAVGLSHVFVSAVERGTSRLSVRHWQAFIDALPGLTIPDLAAASVAAGRLEVDAALLTEGQRASLAAKLEAEARAA